MNNHILDNAKANLHVTMSSSSYMFRILRIPSPYYEPYTYITTRPHLTLPFLFSLPIFHCLSQTICLAISNMPLPDFATHLPLPTSYRHLLAIATYSLSSTSFRHFSARDILNVFIMSQYFVLCTRHFSLFRHFLTTLLTGWPTSYSLITYA